MKKLLRDKYTHGFACYGFPGGIEAKITFYLDAWREGGCKPICEDCIASAAKTLIEAMRELHAKALNESRKA